MARNDESHRRYLYKSKQDRLKIMSGVVFPSLVVFVSEIAVIELAELNRLICSTSTSCALMPYA